MPIYFLNFYFNLRSRIHVGCHTVLLTLLLGACGGCSSSSSGPADVTNLSVPVAAFTNSAALSVNGGPSGNQVNRLYTTVTVCIPGSSTQCTELDHILVDTGSVGLRVLASELNVPLPRALSNGGQSLINCVQFIDNTYAWGPVATADVRWGGKVASNIPIQVIADPAVSASGSTCRTGATPILDTSTAGAKGILGVGLFKEDCGTGCATVAGNGFYFACASATCSSVTGTRVPLIQQIKHPVPFFGTDSNGIVIDLPAVSIGGANRVDGTVTFGIGTQSNNQTGTVRTLTTDAAGNISAIFAGRTLSKSFIDSGSNGNYFDAGGLPLCTLTNNFYCPLEPTTLSAILAGTNGTSVTIPFAVTDSLQTNAAIRPGLAGPIGNARAFDFGLPFFLGRRVFFGIEESATPLGTGPFYAF